MSRIDEAWTLSDVRVASEGATLTVAGRGKAATGELDLAVELPTIDFLNALAAGRELSMTLPKGKQVRFRLDGSRRATEVYAQCLREQFGWDSDQFGPTSGDGDQFGPASPLPAPK